MELVIEDTVKKFSYELIQNLGIPKDLNNYYNSIIKPLISTYYLPYSIPINVTQYNNYF